MEVKVLAFVLLVERLVALGFSSDTIRMQLPLLKLRGDTGLVKIRKLLFLIVSMVWIGNLIPITIDTVALFADIGRNPPSTLGASYAISNATTAMISSIGWWLTYRLAFRLSKLRKER